MGALSVAARILLTIVRNAAVQQAVSELGSRAANRIARNGLAVVLRAIRSRRTIRD